jgi:hypothetical protein
MRVQKPATPESVARRGECRSLSTAQVQALVEPALREHNITPYEMRFATEPVFEGALFDLSGSRPAWPDGSEYAWCYVAFINPIEGRDCKWAHPAWFVFVPAMGEGKTLISPHDFPPHHTAPSRHPLEWVSVLAERDP